MHVGNPAFCSVTRYEKVKKKDIKKHSNRLSYLYKTARTSSTTNHMYDAMTVTTLEPSLWSLANIVPGVTVILAKQNKPFDSSPRSYSYNRITRRNPLY